MGERRKVKIYKNYVSDENLLPSIYTLGILYDSSFYCGYVNGFGAKRSNEIIRKCNNGVLWENQLVVLEDVKTGYRQLFTIHKNGTLLNM